MQLFVGVLTALGLVSLFVVLDCSGALVAITESFIDRIMPFNFKVEVLTGDAAKAAIKRTRSSDDVTEYVDLLKAVGATDIGQVIKLPVEALVVMMPADPKRKQNPEAHREMVDFIVDSVSEDDPDGITVRQMKRRLRAAIKVLGFEMKWREPKGWLIGEIVASTPVTTEDGSDTESEDEDDTELEDEDDSSESEDEDNSSESENEDDSSESEATPEPPASTPNQNRGNGGRRVIRP